jgi:hypothetical protein
MPKKETIERARRDENEGKSSSTQAGEFVREEIEEIRGGKHGARSAKQAIAIGLSSISRSVLSAAVSLSTAMYSHISDKSRSAAALAPSLVFMDSTVSESSKAEEIILPEILSL